RRPFVPSEWLSSRSRRSSVDPQHGVRFQVSQLFGAGWSSTRLLLGFKDDLIPMKALVKLCRLLAPFAKRIHLGFGQVLYPYKVVLACADADQFVKLGLDRRPVAILRILN